MCVDPASDAPFRSGRPSPKLSIGSFPDARLRQYRPKKILCLQTGIS
jgi:hypothetical protein